MVLSVGEDIGSISSFINKLIDAGYKHRDTVYDYGDYAVRGSIIDIYPLGSRILIELIYSIVKFTP